MSLTKKQLNEMLSQLQPGTTPANALGQLTLMASQQARNDYTDITKKQRNELAKKQKQAKKLQEHMNERRFGHSDPNVFGLDSLAKQALGQSQESKPGLMDRFSNWRNETNEKAQDLTPGQAFFRGSANVLDGLTGSRLFGMDGIAGTAVNKWGNEWMQQAMTDDVRAGMKGADLLNEFGGSMVPMAGAYKATEAGVKAMRAGSNALAQMGKGGNIAYRGIPTTGQRGADLSRQTMAETAGIGGVAGLGYNTLENTMAGIGPGGDQRSNMERGLTTLAEGALGAGGDVAIRGLGRLLSRNAKIDAPITHVSDKLPPPLDPQQARRVPPGAQPFNVLADKPPEVNMEFDLLGGRGQTNPKVDFNTQSPQRVNLKELESVTQNYTTHQNAKRDLELTNNAYTHAEQNFIKQRVKEATDVDFVPQNIKFSKPAYTAGAHGRYNVEFESDVEKMLYSATTPTRRNSKTGEVDMKKGSERFKMLQTLAERTGKTTDELHRMGEQMREQMKLQVKQKRQSPELEDDVIHIPRMLDVQGSQVDVDDVAQRARQEFANSDQAKKLVDQRSKLEQDLVNTTPQAQTRRVDDLESFTNKQINARKNAFVNEQKEAINTQVKQTQQQAKRDLDEFKTALKNTEDQFVTNRIKQTGYDGQKAQWDLAKKAKTELKDLKSKIGNRIFVPKENVNDFPNFPKGMMVTSKADGRYDIYKAAEVAGFGNDVEGFANYTDYLSSLSKVKQKDVVTVSPKEVETKARQEFKKSSEYKALQDTFNQIKQGYDEQISQFKSITNDEIASSFQHTDEGRAIQDTLKQAQKPNVNVEAQVLGNSQPTKVSPAPKHYKINRNMPKESQKEIKNVMDTSVGPDGKLQVSTDEPSNVKVSSFEKQLSDSNAVFKKLDAMVNGVKPELTGVAGSLWKQAERLGRARGVAYDTIDKKLKPALRELSKKNGKYNEKQFDDYVQAKHYSDIYKQKEIAEKSLPIVSKQIEDISVKLQDSSTKNIKDLKSQMKKLQDEQLRLQETLDYELPKGWELDRVQDIISRSSKNQSLVQAQKDFTMILRTEFKKMADAGNISQDFYNNSVAKHGNYIPMFRQMTEDDLFSPQPAYKYIKGRQGGGEQQIKDPIESAINQILYYNIQSERNLFFKSLESLVTNPKTSKYFAKAKEGTRIGDKGTFTVFNDGVQTTYRVSDEIAFALDHMTPKQMNGVFEGLGKITQTFKKGITDYNPLFYPVSTVRDGAQAVVNARHNVRVVRDIGAGLLDAFVPQHWKKQLGIKDYRSLYEQSGASHSQLIGGDMSAQKILKQIKDPKYASARKYLSILPEIGRRSEMSTRLSVMRATERAGKSVADQIHEAVDVTNYMRAGASAREINKLAMFFNPSVRGLDRNLQMFREGPEALAKHGMKIAAYGMAPAALSASIPYLPKEMVPWMSDDQRMKMRHLNDWEHNMFLHFPHMDGERIIRIHKPYGIGQLFMNPIQEVVRAQGEQRPMEIERLGKELVSTNLPPMTISMLTPALVLSGGMSKDPLTGIDIVPQRLSGVETSEQYDHGTLEMAKEIGSWVGISPKRIEYVMRRSAGAVGDMTVSTLDYLMQEVGMLDKKTSETPTERQWHKRLEVFLRPEYTRSGVVSDAYDLNQQIEGERRGETKKIRDAARASNPLIDESDLDRYLRKGSGMYNYSKEVEREYTNDLVSKLGDNAQLIRNIESAEKLSAKEKDTMIKNINREEMHFLEQNREIINALKSK